MSAPDSDNESTSAGGYSHTWYATPPEGIEVGKTPAKPPYVQVAVSILNDSNRFSRIGKEQPKIIKDKPSTKRPHDSSSSSTDTTKRRLKKAVLQGLEFFPFGEPDVEQLRRTQEEEVRQRIHRTSSGAARTSSGMSQMSSKEARKAAAEDEEADALVDEQIDQFEKMVKDWQGVFAICGGQRIILARPSKKEKLEFMWQVDLKDDELYHVTWSYDPFTYEPLIACGGGLGLIYILEPGLHKIRRTLKGHGDSILSARFSPTHPHILASASGDRTVRIWNIFGGDLKEEATDDPHSRSRNYPMGDADEGDACIFVLAGEGAGGHQWEIVTLAFHPTQRAVVTGGMDYGVRIWALPEYPVVTDPAIRKTEMGYRPKKIYFPVFATNRLHEDAIDCIEWLTDDILVSQTRNTVLVWQWLGFHRYFGGQIEGDPKPQRTDFNNCHSFRMLAHYPLPGSFWYRRFGFHQAWGEHDEDSGRHGHTTGPLLVVINGDTQGVLVFNPMHMLFPDGNKLVPPRFSGRNDPCLPIEIDLGLNPTSSQTRDPRGDPAGPDSSPLATHIELPIKEEDGVELPQISRKVAPTIPPRTGCSVPLLQPWLMPARILQAALRKVCPKERGDLELHTVAISPRGGQYIVATGTYGSIVLFQLKPLL